MAFVKAVKYQEPIRLALIGPANSGKTYTALRVGTAMASALGGRVAYIDTEHGSAKKYADTFDFDVVELTNFHPKYYVEAIGEAVKAGYAVIVIDSLSHAWAGAGGILETVDKLKARDAKGLNAWREATPMHNSLVEAMLACKAHLIVTMRSKMEYVQERDEQTGKIVVRKLGLQPVQRDGLEYEFDVVGDMDLNHNLVISKTRHSKLDGLIIPTPGESLAAELLKWSGTGESQRSDAEPALPKRPEPEPDATQTTTTPIPFTTVSEKKTEKAEKGEKDKLQRFLAKVQEITDADPQKNVMILGRLLLEDGYDAPSEVPSTQRMNFYIKYQKATGVV